MATHENKRSINDFFAGSSPAKRVKTEYNGASAPCVIPDVENVRSLVEMGFSEKQASMALVENDNDVEKAIEWCLGNPIVDGDDEGERERGGRGDAEPISPPPASSKRTVQADLSQYQTSEEEKPLKDQVDEDNTYSKHTAYPFPILNLSPSLRTAISDSPSKPGKLINDQPDLDLVYHEPYLARTTADALFQFLRSNLPFYRVEYDIKRGSFAKHIKTPRYTTVFGLDATSLFTPTGTIITALAKAPVDPSKDKNYSKYAPRPIPQCLDDLRRSTEASTGQTYNFCLVNYYASGADSISYHSDDERFLGVDPAIASFTLGARRDFLMKHKPPATNANGTSKLPAAMNLTDTSARPPFKLPLASGDMVLMRGRTQSNWLHSIPKRSGAGSAGGRINITFRKALVRAGTENYYNYNVGVGPVFGWDERKSEMRILSDEELRMKRERG